MRNPAVPAERPTASMIRVPPGGAQRINDEFEIAADAEFERHWSRVELFGRAFVLAGLAGWLGSDPWRHPARLRCRNAASQPGAA